MLAAPPVRTSAGHLHLHRPHRLAGPEPGPPPLGRLLRGAVAGAVAAELLGRARYRRPRRPARCAREAAEQADELVESGLAQWHERRLDLAARDMDWSRCFVSVLVVDTSATPSYTRARIVQRLLDELAEWNGLGKVVEAYACVAPGKTLLGKLAAHAEDDDPESSVQAAEELAANVGMRDGQLGNILRKLGAGWTVTLQDEDLREHGLIVAVDREARDSAAEEMRAQNLDPEAGNLLLLSDLVWHYERSRGAIWEAECVDGSGADFIDEDLLGALRRFEFERTGEAQLRGDAQPGSAYASAQEAFDLPPWPRKGAAAKPADWRRLHCAMVKGSVGLAWFLVCSWRAGYANPLA